LAFGPDGHLYLADSSGHAVLRFDGTTGAFIDTFASGLGNPFGLTFTPEPSAVPEPSSAMLLGLGGLACAGRLLRRRKSAAATGSAA
jgi:hypothetical protein